MLTKARWYNGTRHTRPAMTHKTHDDTRAMKFSRTLFKMSEEMLWVTPHKYNSFTCSFYITWSGIIRLWEEFND